MTKTRTLTAEQLAQFLEYGYIKVPNAIPEAIVKEWTASVWERAGVDTNNKATWPKGGVFLKPTRSTPISDINPKLWDLICDLVGGKERIEEPNKHSLSDSFLVNFPVTVQDRTTQQFEAAAKHLHLKTWHKDFPENQNHFLGSRDAALLAFILWTGTDDVGQGATEMACDSVGSMAKVLKGAPQGLPTDALNTNKQAADCKRFATCYGDAGTVYLVHPFMLHRSAWNTSDNARVMTNRSITLKENLKFDRPESELSPVEASILRALGTPVTA